MIATTISAPQRCPACGGKIDAHTCMSGVAVPSPGDVTVCVHCCEFLIFGPELALEVTTIEGLSSEVQDQLIAIVTLLKQRGAR